MRDLTGLDAVRRFMERIGAGAKKEVRVYFTGGVSAVLQGWRDSTIDIDLTFTPENDEIFRDIPGIKEELHLNIELAAPSNFIPPLPGWEERSVFIQRVGKASFYHYDFYSQALAKIERGHAQDLLDVGHMRSAGLIRPDVLLQKFSQIVPNLYRYPAINAASFQKAVEDFAWAK